jgi:hypothetical protein
MKPTSNDANSNLKLVKKTVSRPGGDYLEWFITNMVINVAKN